MANTDETTRKFEDEPDRLTEVLIKLESLSSEVARLRESVESRNRETRPMPETLEAIRVDIGQLREGQEELRNGQEEIRKRVFTVERKLDVLNNHMLEWEANFKYVDERVLAHESR